MDAEDWLRDTERKLNIVVCSDDEKLRYVTYLLSGPTTTWWENLLAIQPSGIGITWTQFKQKFRETHVLDSIMELKRREFENLKQNDSPVMRYATEFSVLSCYVTDEVDIEEKRKKRFMKGLHPYMKMQLRLTRPTEFQELVDVAITLEDDYKTIQEERKKNLRMEPKKYPFK
jgi:hypothetical protein